MRLDKANETSSMAWHNARMTILDWSQERTLSQGPNNLISTTLFSFFSSITSYVSIYLMSSVKSKPLIIYSSRLHERIKVPVAKNTFQVNLIN